MARIRPNHTKVFGAFFKRVVFGFINIQLFIVHTYLFQLFLSLHHTLSFLLSLCDMHVNDNEDFVALHFVFIAMLKNFKYQGWNFVRQTAQLISAEKGLAS